MGHTVKEEYFSGQGVVMIATRDANGTPQGFRPLGNCPAVAIKNATTTLEHKEATTGQRGTDKRLTTEVKVGIEITLENYNSKNLAMVLRGTKTAVAGAAVVDESVVGFPGGVAGFAHMKVSAVTVKQGATSLTAYTNDTTPWDYRVNTEAGSVMLNDASSVAAPNLGTSITAVAVGATTTLTVTQAWTVGDSVYISGLTGADAATLNGKTFAISTRTATTITIAADTSAKTITAGSGKAYNLTAPITLLASYTYATQQEVGAFTSGNVEYYLRFEGLNTAEQDSPVVVEVFKFSVDPTQDFSMISDQIQSFVLQGSVLKDSLRSTGSQYYKVMKIDA